MKLHVLVKINLCLYYIHVNIDVHCTMHVHVHVPYKYTLTCTIQMYMYMYCTIQIYMYMYCTIQMYNVQCTCTIQMYMYSLHLCAATGIYFMCSVYALYIARTVADYTFTCTFCPLVFCHSMELMPMYWTAMATQLCSERASEVTQR